MKSKLDYQRDVAINKVPLGFAFLRARTRHELDTSTAFVMICLSTTQNAMKNTRTFVAIPVDPRQASHAIDLIDDLSELGYGYKWASEENMHITLNFLGDVPEIELNQVCRCVKTAVDSFESFELSIEGIGAFPSLQKPRIVWAGIHVGQQEIQELQQEIALELKEIGFPPEVRPYTPHLTLGRIQSHSRPDAQLGEQLQQFKSFNAGSKMVSQVVVYSSFLDRSGPIYTPISRIRFDETG